MDLTFERGNPTQPVGHAVLYFSIGVPERILATYLIVPPIALNISKYMPPMFAANLPIDAAEMSRPVPLPPIPEEVPSRTYLQRMATLRGDDLIYAGAIMDDDPQRLLLETGYAAETYKERYDSFIGAGLAIPEPEEPEPELDSAVAVYSVMGEGQRLAELTKMTGALREGIEHGDMRTASENLHEIRSLLETLPSKYHGERILAAVQEQGERGRSLSQLLLERAYALHREEYLDVGRLDREIETLEGGVE